MENQIKKLSDTHTWEKVTLPTGKRAIPCKWVFSYKNGVQTSGDSVMLESARLVARGDLQRAGIDYGETYGTVVKLVFLRLLLAVAAICEIPLTHWDIIAAFWNGHLEEVVYMLQPPGMDDGSGLVLLLHTSIYGLCQSAGAFFNCLDKIMEELGWKRLHAEWAIWISSDKKSFVACYVDDILVGTSEEIK